MRVYETILSILEKKGPLPIPVICHEVNHILTTHHVKPILPSHVKSIVRGKKDLFQDNKGKISIQLDKVPASLTATIESFEGISYQLRADFHKNSFASLEWRNKDYCQPFSDLNVITPGNLAEFKCQLYKLKIWEWQPSYREENGIIIERKCWSIKFITKGKVYTSEGTDTFPVNWVEFCQAVERLTGNPFR